MSKLKKLWDDHKTEIILGSLTAIGVGLFCAYIVNDSHEVKLKFETYEPFMDVSREEGIELMKRAIENPDCIQDVLDLPDGNGCYAIYIDK